MAVELINVGQIANDGTGDDLREAFIKINQNLEELDLRDDEQTTASNIGSIGEGVFSQKINYDLQFKKLIAGQDVSLSSNDNAITISANGGLKTLLIIADNGNKTLEGVTHLNINGGENITTRLADDVLTIEYDGPTSLSDDLNPMLANTLDASAHNIANVGTIDATEFVGNFTGNLTGNVHGVDVRQLNSIFEPNNFDMGEISTSITNLYQWLLSDIDIDFGSFAAPDQRIVDLGSFV